MIFTPQQIRRALEELKERELELELNHGNKDVVLIAADSVSALKRAYPNYYHETGRFIQLIERAAAL
jgi:hypothetical protein